MTIVRSSRSTLGTAAWVLALAVTVACQRGDRREAEQAVRTYVARLSEAYRAGDESLVDPLVGDQQGMKLLGLIGVKQDAGVVLDAKLLELAFTRVERDGAEWIVETKERWYYADRKIGTLEQVGEDSTDSYEMRYRFARKGGKLILEELSFVGAPVVGRKAPSLSIDTRVLHGLPPEDAAQGAGPGAAAPGATPPPGHPPLPPPGPAGSARGDAAAPPAPGR